MGGYAPPSRVLWDPWFITDRARGRYLMYHLSAPAGLSKAQRDDQSEIWLAESTDLETWECLGPAITAGPRGSHFDLAIWSGMTTQGMSGPWLTFFTGRNRRDGHRQYVCAATSPDGRTWSAEADPLLPLPPDHPTYDDALDGPVFPAWRDPCHVELSPNEHLLLVTAQHRAGPNTLPGCVATATSPTALGPYRLGAPLLTGGHYAQIELPHLVHRHNRWWLFFSAAAKDYPEDTRGETGLHCWVSDEPLGEYAPVPGVRPGVVDGGGTSSGLYGTKLVETLDGNVVALGWYWSPACFEAGRSDDAHIAGATPLTLSAPQSVRWTPENVELCP